MSPQTLAPVDHVNDIEINDDDILIVRSAEARYLYREAFPLKQMCTVHSLAFMHGRRPGRVFVASLGVSRQAWEMRARLEALVEMHGTELYRIYEDGTVIRT